MRLEIQVSEESIEAELKKRAHELFRSKTNSWEWDENVKRKLADACDSALSSVISELMANEYAAMKDQVREVMKRKIQSRLDLAIKAAEGKS